MKKSKILKFNEIKIAGLQEAYDKAVKGNLNQFQFEGDMFVTHFAKYMLQHLKG